MLNGDATTLMALALNYLVLSVVARGVPGLSARRRRLWAAAAIGTVPLVLLLGGDIAPSALWMLATPPAMCGLAFGGAPKAAWWRAVGWTYALGLTVAGLFLALAILDVPAWPGWLMAPAVVWVIRGRLAREVRRPWAERHGLVPLRIWILGRVVEVSALVDSGTRLADPATGRPLVVVAAQLVWADANARLRRDLSRAWTGQAVGRGSECRGVVAVTTATGRGWLPVVAAPHAEMEVEGRWIALPPLAVALSACSLAPDGSFQALLPASLDVRPRPLGA
jgi:hypothetical protein